MSHCDAETLSVLALGSPVAHDAGHLASCPECQAELSGLRAAASHARTALQPLARPDDDLDISAELPVVRLTPPGRVWDAIAAATEVTTAPRPEAFVLSEPPSTPRTAPHVNGFKVAVPTVPAAAPPADPVRVDPAVPIASRPRSPRNRRRKPLRDTPAVIGIAATALIIGGLGGYGISNAISNRSASASVSGSESVVASTQLAGLRIEPSAAGDATVVQTATGRELDVDVSQLSSVQGFYEVWLINANVTQMVSVGVLEGSSGRFTLPAGIDLDQFPLVDISIQDYANKGAHSGRSVLRGSLTA